VVEVRIERDSRARLSSFFASGHAGWAEAGHDVVCAAVSTLLQAAWLGLDEIAGVKVRAVRDPGRLELSWPAETRDDAGVRAIVETVALSLETLAGQFPDQIRVAVKCADTVRPDDG
jgi:uncharacterized protein YsxB (DUF464 family)